MLVKLEWFGYRMMKKLWRYIKPFSSDTGTLRTDGLTDRQICYINIAHQHTALLTRDKKREHRNETQIRNWKTQNATVQNEECWRCVREIDYIWHVLETLWSNSSQYCSSTLTVTSAVVLNETTALVHKVLHIDEWFRRTAEDNFHVLCRLKRRKFVVDIWA